VLREYAGYLEGAILASRNTQHATRFTLHAYGTRTPHYFSMTTPTALQEAVESRAIGGDRRIETQSAS
jgi:hypothetical protein